jgi:Domain of unknown function (DUF5916)
MLRVGLVFLLFFNVFSASGQEFERPSHPIGKVTGEIRLDGDLSEESWQQAPVLSDLKTTEPIEGGSPTGLTEVRIIAEPKNIYFGIICYDPDPAGIVSFSKLRDVDLRNEDHIRIVLDPSMDGQSGYVFAVNPNAARYDALVSNRGETENKNWDGVWEAKTQITEQGWTVEIKIPIQSINYKKGLKAWGFNVERRIQRLLETIRWSNVVRDQWFTQTSKAGIITNLPDFTYGWGTNIRPSLVGNYTETGPASDVGIASEFRLEPSLDVNQRLGPNVTASLTVNTDFAETEVDSRRTNLTRFPLFFPEKRSFFLEGADIFEFGLGLRRNLIPFFSRRIGLYRGTQIPIIAGGKVNGRLGNTAFGGLVMGTDDVATSDFDIPNAQMGVVRVRQNIMKESSAGIIGTFGDPIGRDGSYMGGVDFTYQTTSFHGDKNVLIGVTGLYTDRADLDGDQTAFSFKFDYPNDLWDISLTYIRIGDAFDPSLGFVPRKAMNNYRLGVTYAPRPEWPWVRQMFNELFLSYITDLKGNWESYRAFAAPINWRLESGDRFEANIVPTGERLTEPFKIAEEVTIPVGEYQFMRYRLEMAFAAKRKINGQATWWFGTFYDGILNTYELEVNWNPLKVLTFEFSGIRNVGSLPYGNFDQILVGGRVRLNVTPDLQLNSFVQYDTDSKAVGMNMRLHYIFLPLGDLFVVYNHNTVQNLNQEWQLHSSQLIVKVRYTFRF